MQKESFIEKTGVENLNFTNVEIVCTFLNAAAIIVDLTVHKWYKLLKRYHNDYDISKWIAGLCSSAISFLLTSIVSVFAIINKGSTYLGWIELIACVLTTSIHFIIELKKLYRNEMEKKTYKSYDGVFAVSAIVVTQDKERFLLIKRKQSDDKTENKWVQPGVYYRTNKLHKDAKVLKPFHEELIASIEAECGLTTGQYRPIQLNSVIVNTKDTFQGSALTARAAEYYKNKLSQTPFLIQIEESESEKRSGTKRHIDCFYAFELSIDDDQKILNGIRNSSSAGAKYDEIDTFTYEEIQAMSEKDGLHRKEAIYHCYPDLAIILNKFLEIWRKELFQKKFSNNIRYCTFNPNKHTIWMRLNNNCNLNCEFCLMLNKVQNMNVNPYSIQEFRDFWDSLSPFDKSEYHLVVTGGEPFLAKELYQTISYMEQHSNGKITSITICTNGTLGVTNAKQGALHHAKINLDKLISDECPFKSKLKFVINMSSYDENSFTQITQSRSSVVYNRQCEFIALLQKNNIRNITANVVMTDILKNNLADYFKTWKRLNIRNIAFSYAIQQGINSRNKTNSINTLSKEECISLYNQLGNGGFPIERFENIELMIPSCDEKDACKENGNIESCFQSAQNGWEHKEGCIDN